jgi:hypothetical protein
VLCEHTFNSCVSDSMAAALLDVSSRKSRKVLGGLIVEHSHS